MKSTPNSQEVPGGSFIPWPAALQGGRGRYTQQWVQVWLPARNFWELLCSYSGGVTAQIPPWTLCWDLGVQGAELGAVGMEPALRI